jgi:hypothetical protein
MTIEPNDFQNGKEHWEVREHTRRTAVGAREYRVMRGSSMDTVYRSAERVRATAVGTALNELESQESPWSIQTIRAPTYDTQ